MSSAFVFVGKNALIPVRRLFRWLGKGPMTIAELALLGGFRLRLAGGEVIDLPGQKDRALLAFLALHPGGPQSRDKLAGLLWSERGDQQARDSLKHALTR